MMKSWILYSSILLIAATAFGAKNERYSNLKASADKGNVESQYQLAVMCEKGDGVTQSYMKAIKWYKKAAKQGHAQAQTNLGVMYASGQGVLVDNVESIRWTTQAAEQGHAPAQSYLGSMYAEGYVIEKDYVKAYMWLRIAYLSGETDVVSDIEKIKRSMTAAQIAEADRNIKSWRTKHKKSS